MPRQFKVTACLTFVLAVSFYIFFQVSKQNPALSQVNAFADDPFDSVGSLGVQLALFTALLLLVRAFRPYQAHKVGYMQQLLLSRSAYTSCLSVAVTLVADVIAMLRYPAIWFGFPAGFILAALLGGMLLFTALVGWLIYRSTRNIPVSPAQNAWTRAVIISIVGILILAVYPAAWRQRIPGEIFTIFVGIAILFVSVWALGLAISPYRETHFEDVLDDLVAIYRWLSVRTGPFVGLFSRFEKLQRVSLIHPLLSWLNPRKHLWNFAILLGIFIGIVFALAELLGEGMPARISQLILIATLFLSIEAAGILLAYAIFAKPLGLFRHD